MSLFLYFAASAQMLLGFGAWFLAASAIHEAIAAILFGMGVLAAGLAAIPDRLPRA